MNREDIMTLVERYALAMRLVDRHGNQYGDRDLLTLTHQQIREGLKALVVSEREACAELVWPTQQVKVWSDKELTDMTVAFNRAQEKHGWYETIMDVGATALKDRAAAIRARSKQCG